MKIIISYEISMTDLWTEVFGSSWEIHHWWSSVQYHGDTNRNNPGMVTLGIQDPENPDSIVSKKIDEESLVEAVVKTIEGGFVDACTGEKISLDDRFQWDSCSGDAVLQMAVLGDIVYG